MLDSQDILIHRLKELQVHNLKEEEYYKLMMFFTNCKTLNSHFKSEFQIKYNLD